MYPWKELPPPLSAQELYVLLALSYGETHAYRLRGQIEKHSLGSVKIADGTLYPILTRFHDQGLIDLAGKKPAGKSGKERMHYAVSGYGIIRLKEELTRLKHVVEMARVSGLLDDRVPADIQRLLLNVRRDNG